MTDPRAVSFVLSIDSEEAAAIADLLEPADGSQPRYHVFRMQGGWEQRPVLSLVELGQLYRTVVLVQCPDHRLAQSLEAAGKHVIMLDHRRRFQSATGWFGARLPLTTLEQVEDIIGRRQPGEDRALLIAETAGGLPALTHALCCRELKRADLPERWGEPEGDRKALLELPVEGLDGSDPAPAACPGGPASVAPAWRGVYDRIRDQLWNFRDRSRATGGGGTVTREEAVRAIRCRVFDTGRRVDGDPELILVLAPERYRPVLEEAVYAWWADQHGVPPSRMLEILALFVPGDDEGSPPVAVEEAQPTAAELITDGRRLALIEELLTPDGIRESGLDRLAIECACDARLQLRVSCQDAGDPEQRFILSRFVDRLLDECLVGNRPVKAWRTSFLQPLQLNTQKEYAKLRTRLIRRDVEGWEYKSPSQEELAYIVPAARRFVAPSSPDSHEIFQGTLLSFERMPEGINLEMVRAEYNPPITETIRRVRLHLLTNCVLLVEWTIEQTELNESAERDEDRERPEERRRWRLYLEDDAAGAGMATLAGVLDRNRHFRHVYSSYKALEAGAADACKAHTLVRLIGGDRPAWLNHGAGVSPQEPGHGPFFTTLLRALLGPDLGGLAEEQGAYALLADDRSLVITSIAPWGEPPYAEAGSAEFRALLARLHMVEPYGSGPPYDPTFTERELEGGIYDRFASMGTWYGISSHSFVCLTYGRYGRRVIHACHMSTIYSRLYVLTLLQKAALQAYGVAIAKALAKWQPGRSLPPEYRALRPDYLRFTNLLWLPQITSQVQGVELFRRMQGQAGLESEHQRLRGEIEETDSYWQEQREGIQEDRIRILTFIGVPFAIFVTLMGWSYESPPLWCWFNEYFQLQHQVTVFAITIILLLFLFMLLYVFSESRACAKIYIHRWLILLFLVLIMEIFWGVVYTSASGFGGLPGGTAGMSKCQKVSPTCREGPEQGRDEDASLGKNRLTRTGAVSIGR